MEYGPDDQVERDAPEPPFQQLAEILRARVTRGDWKPNRAIPSENALAEHYGLSRPTVRRAIAALADNGLVYAVSGRGTYVAEQKTDESAAGE
ncbi:GntR family transcriptional regulator [Streptomyces sp. Isolate_219]|uniref:GntR family transcriptional regulator n=1 Tax=Streptomyces sp. Isolate_219 TaxID=2950110 RepID=UPI0021C73EE9|nr:GntR family transcriptional regulator [Streptomyces sp. Isolate_219]MCR8576143.1 GntR family transcriptional regulator [Streptomyces sp. Isolate_219]